MRLMLLMLSLLFAVGCAKTVPNPDPNAEIIERYTKEAQVAIERERADPPEECAYEVEDDCDLRSHRHPIVPGPYDDRLHRYPPVAGQHSYQRPNFITDSGTLAVGAEGLQKQVENSFRQNRCFPTCTGSTFGDNAVEQSFYNSMNQDREPSAAYYPKGSQWQGYQDFSNGLTFPGYIDFNKAD